MEEQKEDLCGGADGPHWCRVDRFVEYFFRDGNAGIAATAEANQHPEKRS